MRRRNLLIAAGTVVALGIWGYATVPRFVKTQIERRYPFVKVDRVELHWPYDTITLYGVHVERPNARGDFERVVVTRADESVAIHGGTFDFTIADRKDPTSGERRAITADGLQGVVHKGGYAVELEGLRVDAKTACFDRAHVHDPEQVQVPWLNAEKGCVDRDGSRVVLAAAYVTSEAVGHFVKELPASEIHAEGIEVFPKEMRARMHAVTYAETTANDVLVTYEEPRVDLQIGSVTTKHPRAYTGPMTFREVKTSFEPKTLREQPLMIETAGVKLFIDPRTLGVQGDEECNAWLDALPQEMHVPAMDGLRFKGRLAFEVQVKPEVKLDLRNKCKAICPVPSIEALKSSFSYTVYDKDNDEGTRETGPKSEEWVRLADIAPFMPLAVTNLEDPSFAHHHGFVPGALRNSLREDIEKDRFLRGGSTITMQLAKNVFLKRSKTIGRKVQEALLTIALESCLTKDQIMETYLNVVEFGPDLYGIGPAAKHYFDEEPYLLDAKQSFYLASILPKPKKAPKPDERTMARVTELMKILVNRGSIDEDMLTQQMEWEKF